MTWTTDTWTGCYRDSWKGIVEKESFKHPAKYASGLVRRIYAHLADDGAVHDGDVVIDPFGGVALGALDAMRYGLRWIGVEVEEKFVRTGNANVSRWMRDAAGSQRWGGAVLLHGDSRCIVEVVQEHCAACVSSPPYAESIDHAPGNKAWVGKMMGNIGQEDYGNTNGQLAAMNCGEFSASVSSPPYDGTRLAETGDIMFTMRRSNDGKPYGTSPGQLLQESGETFWSASKVIVAGVHALLRPDAHAVWVVKDYVRGGAVVPFSDQWRRLCESVGFRTIHEHHAMLVEDHAPQILIGGGVEVRRTERKSFFKRLHEKRGGPRVDWEVVWCMERA